MSEKQAARQTERAFRAAEVPLVPNLPSAQGIRTAIELSPELGKHLLGIADALLVKPFPNSSLSRTESELIATSVSAANNCFFCMDSHACFAIAVADEDTAEHVEHLTEALKEGNTDHLNSKMRSLVQVALNVQSLAGDYEKEHQDIQAAQEAGASPGDIQHTVAIAAAFSMYNRFVEGFRAPTPPNTGVYQERAHQIAEYGYLPPA